MQFSQGRTSVHYEEVVRYGAASTTGAGAVIWLGRGVVGHALTFCFRCRQRLHASSFCFLGASCSILWPCCAARLVAPLLLYCLTGASRIKGVQVWVSESQIFLAVGRSAGFKASVRYHLPSRKSVIWGQADN
jgi:hypothetical protein